MSSVSSAQIEPSNILICCINPAEDGFFVPLIHANLKSYCDQFTDLKEAYHWLEPIMLPETFAGLDIDYDFSSVAVFGISCYQWNHYYQYELAKYVKERNPRCTVIAGGPHVDYTNPSFFIDHPYVDFAVPAEGEIPFKNILYSRLHDFQNIHELTGVYINPVFGNCEFLHCQPLDLENRPSPWLTMKDFWVDYFAKYGSFRLAASFESSRGCPYLCAYCDWGSKTNLKMRYVPTQIAKQEIEFILGALKPSFVFWMDSNLGIAKRDAELVQHFAAEKKKSGFPQWLYYNNHKNDYANNLAIANLFRSADLLTKYVLSLQHTDKEVLSAIRRTNLPEEQIIRLVRELQKIDYPIFVQLIVGCPGDTFEKWLDAFARLMEMGVHSEYRIYPFSFLPNAPAASPEYRAQWALDVIERPDFVAYFFLKEKSLSWALSKSKYVVGSTTFNREDYKKMFLLTWLIQAFHDHGFTQRIAIALRESGQIEYKEFYRIMYDWFFQTKGMKFIARRIESHIVSWLEDESASLLIFNEDVEGYLEPEEDLVLYLYKNFEAFFVLLNRFLQSRLKVPETLLEYQKNILFRPEFRVQSDSAVRLNERWVKYFADSGGLASRDDGFPPAGQGYSNYRVETDKMKFPTKSWFVVEDWNTRIKAFYSQIVQHNIPGRNRAVFKEVVKT